MREVTQNEVRGILRSWTLFLGVAQGRGDEHESLILAQNERWRHA
jgi:hypothetical protein